MEKYEPQLVIYDEIEDFKEPDSPLFNYPYRKRKNSLGTVAFAFPKDLQDQELIKRRENYQYFHHEALMRLSQTCLEPKWYS